MQTCNKDNFNTTWSKTRLGPILLSFGTKFISRFTSQVQWAYQQEDAEEVWRKSKEEICGCQSEAFAAPLILLWLEFGKCCLWLGDTLQLLPGKKKKWTTATTANCHQTNFIHRSVRWCVDYSHRSARNCLSEQCFSTGGSQSKTGSGSELFWLGCGFNRQFPLKKTKKQ